MQASAVVHACHATSQDDDRLSLTPHQFGIDGRGLPLQKVKEKSSARFTRDEPCKRKDCRSEQAGGMTKTKPDHLHISTRMRAGLGFTLRHGSRSGSLV